MTPEEITQIAHKAVAVPIIWIMVAVGTLAFWLSALIVLSPARTNYKKIFLFWLIFTLIVAIFAVFLSISPNLVQAISSLF